MTGTKKHRGQRAKSGDHGTAFRVGVWGLGPHARRNILPALASMAELELAGVHTRNPDVLASEAGRYGCAGWPSPEMMLNDSGLDAVFVATPIGLHHVHGLAVLNAGKHLWLEKPFAPSAAQAKALLQRSRELNLAACEGFMYAYHPQFGRLRELARAPDLGRILSITCRFGLPALETPGFRASKELGGSALLDVGCYPVSAALGLMDGAGFSIRDARVRTPEGGEVDQDGHALLEFEDGTLAHLEWGYGRGYRNDIEVWCEHGSVASERIFSKPEHHEARFTIRNRTGETREIALPPANAFMEMFAAFAPICGDGKLAERERKRIARQAEALDAIAAYRPR